LLFAYEACYRKQPPCKTFFLDCNYSNSNHHMWQSFRPSGFTSICCELDNQLCQNFCHHCRWLLDSKLPLTLLFVVDAVTWYTVTLVPLLFLSLLADFCHFNVVFCLFLMPKLTPGSTAACHHHHCQLIGFENYLLPCFCGCCCCFHLLSHCSLIVLYLFAPCSTFAQLSGDSLAMQQRCCHASGNLLPEPQVDCFLIVF